ncbi:hypothetical protein PoB_005420900 [Plakobranchus ocellatus]|uniref:Uncharacterized protein n=1 Tax=Plakobranchus ocellatus TaxID=259542 RepID=A0AAV4CAH5_9GAST|nr:hypothetical protein PoB_005420900 [Plakobranchus ocellatus]
MRRFFKETALQQRHSNPRAADREREKPPLTQESSAVESRPSPGQGHKLSLINRSFREFNRRMGISGFHTPFL